MAALVAASSGGGTVVIVYLLAYVVGSIAIGGVLRKAGEPFWAGFVPIYNTLLLLKVIGRPWWWIVLLIIPFVDIVMWAVIAYELSKTFGHGGGYAVGIFFLSVIFLLVLGFGASEYRGPSRPSGAAPVPPVPQTPPTAPA